MCEHVKLIISLCTTSPNSRLKRYPSELCMHMCQILLLPHCYAMAIAINLKDDDYNVFNVIIFAYANFPKICHLPEFMQFIYVCSIPSITFHFTCTNK